MSKHNYNSYGAPPPPPGPIFGNPQASVWGDPMLSGNLPPGSIPSAGSLSKPPKSSQTRTKLKSRKLGTIGGLQSLSVTAIDDLSCLEEISLCLKGSSGSLKSLTLSFAESLVSKSQKPHPSNAHNAIHIQEDDATTEPNSPDMTATNTVPTDLDLKREKQAQDQALARIFGLDKGSVSDQKQDKRVEKTLKHTAKSARLSKPDSKTLDNLALHILSTVQLSKLELNIRSKIQDLLEAIIPPSTAPGHKHSSKKHKNASASKKSKYHGNVPPSSMPPGNSGQPSNEFWTGEEIDLLGPGPSKASQNNINIFGGPEYTPSTIPSMPPPPLLDWSSNNSLALSSNPPKNAFGFGDPSNFPLNGPKSHLAPVYPVPSPSSYAYHPNASSHMLSSVSQSVPSYGSIYQSGLLQKLQAQIQFLIIKAKQAGTNPSTIPFDKLLLGLPPEIAKQAKNAISIQANMSHQSHGSFPGKKKKPLPTATITPSDSSPESSSESESDSESSTVQASSNPNNNVDSLDNLISDFDMEHPDLLESEGEEDTDDQDHADRDEKEKSGQESPAAKEDPTVDVIGKGKQKVVLDDAPPPIPVVCNHDALPGDVKEVAKLSTVEESIQEYVRMTHGLSIQELTLSFIPLKSSVLAKALDLTTLRRIVFHNVGAQGAFWAMVEKLVDQGVVFNFQSLLVDDVSAAFISCLGKLPGLKSLHVLRRSNKEFSNTSSKSAVTLSDLHKLGLSKHYETLQSLSVTNLEDDSWDFDDRIIRALSSKAKKLKELAFSVDSNSFVWRPLSL